MKDQSKTEAEQIIELEEKSTHLEEAYRILVEQSLQGLLIIQDGRILFKNQMVSTISGYSSAEINAFSWDEMIAKMHPDDLERVLSSLSDLHNKLQSSLTEEFRFFHKDGTTRWIELYASFSQINGRSALQVAIIDITKQKVIEEANQKIQHRFRSAIEASLDAFYLLSSVRNPANEIVDFRIVEVNENAVKQLGMPREKLIDGLICELFPINRTNGFLERYKNVVETGQPFEEEFYIPPENTAPGWFHHQVVKVDDGVAIMTRNISQIKQAEEIAQEQQHFVQQLTDMAPYQVYVFDLTLKQDIYMNGNTETFLGLPLADIRTKGQELFMERLHPDDLAQLAEFNAQWGDAVDGQLFEREYRLRNAQGEYRWLRSYETVLHRDALGVPTQILGMAVDVTERKRATLQLQESEKRSRTIQETAPIIFIIHQDERIQFINQTGAELLGGSHPAELIGKPILDFIHPDSLPLIENRIQRLQANEKNAPADIRIVGLDGQTHFVQSTSIPFISNGETVVLLMSVDITERKLAELAVKQNELLLRKITENFPDAYITVLNADLTIDFAGGRGFVAQALDSKSFVGRSIPEIYGRYDPSILQQIISAYKKTFSGEEQQFEVVINTETLVYTTVPLPNEHGEIRQILSVVQNITEQRQAERTTKEREGFLQAIFDNSLNGIIVADDAGNYISANQAAATIFGYALDQFIGINISDLQTVQLPSSGERYEKFLGAGQEIGEFEFVHKNGATRVAQYYATRVGKDFNLSVLADITEQKNAERELRQSESRFRTLFNGLPLPTYAWQRVDDDFVLADYNDIANTVTDQRIQNFVGMKASEMYRDRPHILKHLNDCYAQKKTIEQEYEYAFSTGKVSFLNVKYTYVSDELIMVVTDDLTERRQTEASLHQMKQAIEYSPASVVITDKDGVIEYVNPKFCELTGYTLAEAVGQTPNILGSGKQNKAFYAEMWQTIASGEVWQGEFHNKKKNGELYWEYASIVGIQDENGRITHYVAIKEDITERKQLQEENIRQERLAAVGQLAAGIAHDFNNIMAVITLYSDLLAQSPSLSQKQHKQLNIIYQQANHAAVLTSQILDFSRKSLRQPRQLELKSLLDKILEFIERTLSEQIQLHLEPQPGNFTINADPTQLQQIITNLTINARDAMPNGGNIHFHLSHLTLNHIEKAPLPGMSTGQWIVLSIRDTGSGINPDILPKIFEPFFTTKEVGKGSGLGLAQVFGIVKQHGGFIDVASAIGAGTTFTIYFPAVEETIIADHPESEKAIYLGQGEMILLVEDNEKLLEATQLSLEALNYQVITAKNGEEALSVYDQHQDKIALVLSDVVMPILNGYQLVEAFQAKPNPPKIILISGYPRDGETSSKVMSHVAGWIQKPLELHKLANAVGSALRSEGKA